MRKKLLVVILTIAALSQAVLVGCQALNHIDNWIPGQYAASASRMAAGGHIYPDFNDGHGEPSTCYFPGAVLFVRILTPVVGIRGAVVGFAWFSMIIVTFALYAYAVQMGVGRTSALILVLLYSGAVFGSPALGKPDYLGIAFCLAACLLTVLMCTGGSSWWLLVLLPVLVSGGLLKQSMIAGFAGLMFYILFRAPSIRKCLVIGSILLLSGLITLGFLTSIPDCIEHCVRTMSRHPYRKTMIIAAEAAYFFSHFAIAFVPCVVTFGWLLKKGNGNVPPTLQREACICFLCFWFPFTALQFLSLIKEGGGAINMEIAAFAAIPLAVVGLDRVMVPWPSRSSILAGTATAIFLVNLVATREELSTFKHSRAENKEVVSYLKSHFPLAKAFFHANSYFTTAEAGLVPETDMNTLAHFSLAGRVNENVLRSLEAKRFDVILDFDLFIKRQGEPGNEAFQAYGRAIKANYRVYEDPLLPEKLRNKILVPR